MTQFCAWNFSISEFEILFAKKLWLIYFFNLRKIASKIASKSRKILFKLINIII